MASFFRDRTCKLRPHFKNHKCVTLAKRQLAAGSAVGMTAAKLGEAEVLAAGGVSDILIANQIVGRRKMERLARLVQQCDLKVAVDSLENVRSLSQCVAPTGSELGILIEVDIGMGRCGVTSDGDAVNLARHIVELDGLCLVGIQAFEGHAVYMDDSGEQDKLVRSSFQKALRVRRAIEDSGIPVPVLSGGSSATYQITGCIEGMDELQAGSYATMDWRYAQVVSEFDVALSVLARVISKRGEASVLDVGLKGAGCEFGPPRIQGDSRANIPSFLSEEHCIVKDCPPWSVGQTVEILPSHACTTCNLYRHMFVHEDEHIVDVWPIEGSGRLC